MAARSRWMAEEGSTAEEAAWGTYNGARQAFGAAIADVVAFVPENDEEEDARQNAAGRLLMLCHDLDETWLEAEAEKIMPPTPLPSDELGSRGSDAAPLEGGA